MRKLSVFLLETILFLGFIFGGGKIIKAKAEETSVYIGGMSAGFSLKTGGAQVMGFNDVVTEQGAHSPALEMGLRVGDIIKKVGGVRVESIADLNELVNKTKGKEVEIEIARKKEVLKVPIRAVKDSVSNKYKIGIYPIFFCCIS